MQARERSRSNILSGALACIPIKVQLEPARVNPHVFEIMSDCDSVVGIHFSAQIFEYKDVVALGVYFTSGRNSHIIRMPFLDVKGNYRQCLSSPPPFLPPSLSLSPALSPPLFPPLSRFHDSIFRRNFIVSSSHVRALSPVTSSFRRKLS